MEPRWRVLYADRFPYVGGTAKFDIWYAAPHHAHSIESIRVVWDHRTWDAYYICSDRQLGDAEWNEPDGPTEADMVEIERYILLFAPYVNLAPRYTERITEEGEANG
jgi:hypothetical protein